MNFIEQKLTYKQKIKQYGSIENWAKAVFESTSTTVGSDYNLKYENTVSNFDIIEGKFDDSEYKTSSMIFGNGNEEDTNYKFPAELSHYDIISPKLLLLLGEELKRPFNWTAVCLNADAVTMAEEAKYKKIAEKVNEILEHELKRVGAIQQPPQEQPVEGNPAAGQPVDPNMGKHPLQQQAESEQQDTKKSFGFDTYQDARETTANGILNYLKLKEHLEYKLSQGFKNYLVSGDEIYCIDIVANDPTIRIVDPRYFEFSRGTETHFIEDAEWAKEYRYLTLNQVIDEFYEQLTEKQIDQLQDLIGKSSMSSYPSVIRNMSRSDADVRSRDTKSSFGYRPRLLDLVNANLLCVVQMEWKTLRKIGFLSKVNEEGNYEEELVDDDYKAEPDDIIEWKWVNEVWQATNIADEIYIGVRPKQNQSRSMSNPSLCKLSYVGISTTYCLIDKMKKLQALYNIILYHLKLMFAKAGGPGFVMDVAQIPQSEGIDLEKWLYYLKVMGIAFVNSFEEGKGPFEGRTASFNQFQQIDLSLSQSIQFYVSFLDKIEMMIGDVCGVSKQREGQIASSETVGGSERSITQSSHITEYLFNVHNQVKLNCMTALIEEAKLAYMNGKKTAYILGDGSKQYLSLEANDSFLDSDYGVFLSNNSKDFENMQLIRQIAQSSVQSGAVTLKDLIMILNSNSTSKSLAIMKEAEETMKMMQQQQQQQEQKAQMELEQKKMEAENLARQFELDKIDKEYQYKDVINQRDNATKVTVAKLNAETNTNIAKIYDESERDIQAEQAKIEGSSFDSGLERDKLSIEREKMAHQTSMKDKDMQHTVLKGGIENENMKQQMELEKAKPKPTAGKPSK